MISPQYLTEIEERVAKATEGPWVWDGKDYMYAGKIPDRALDEWPEPIITTDGGYYGPNDADRAFIAHARTDIPALLADRKALVELLTSALPYVDPDDVMYSQDGKARVRALHNKIRSAIQEDR